ncbi:hypothetical protein HDU85_000047 [Gaertneriomyces sp. JEL0708]|nr:hypothetical protein HDU85_000047 [Gaertneriomyces sp. JEL0708]
MEVELKVRLPDLTKYHQALALFQRVGQYQRTEHQVNYFFDGSERELQKSRTVFRLREVVLDIPHSAKAVKATATIKGNAVLENGVSTVEEEELPIAQSLLQTLVAHPEDLSSLSSTYGHPLLVKLVSKLRDVNDITVIGSYKTTRDVFSWSQLQIELDKTEISIPSVTLLKLKLKVLSLIQYGP